MKLQILRPAPACLLLLLLQHHADHPAAAAAAAAAAAEGGADTPETGAKISGEKLAELMQLSLPEIKKRMDVIFDLVDGDKDGFITEEEAKAWSSRLKDAMHKHQVRQEFLSIDKDADGKITLEELEVTYTDGADAANQEAHKEEVQKRFAAVDKDKSGSLSLEEVTILMDPGKDPVLMQIEVDEIMAAQDKDKDRTISLEEFLLNEGGALTEPEKEELKKEFSGYDKDKDGRIDEAELRAVIEDPHAHDMQQMLDSFRREINKYSGSSDSSSSGSGSDSSSSSSSSSRLSRDQWTTDYQTFAVSLLTDNGELLRFPEEYEGIELPFKGITEGGEEEDPSKHDEL